MRLSLMLMFLLPNLSWGGEYFHYRLFSSTNLSMKQMWSFERDDKGLWLNGIQYPPQNVILHPDSVTSLNSELLPKKKQSCPAGRYIFEVKRGKKTQQEDGCLGSERFGQLRTAFEALAK